MYQLFLEDAARWVTPGKIAPVAELNFGIIVRLLYRYMALRAMAWYRFGCWCKHKHLPGMTGWVQRRIYRLYGLQIMVGAEIGGGLYLAHPSGMVVVPRRIGKNVSIIAAVTIGMRNEWAFPTIGDNVFIGAGARILGDVTIGDNAVIGANAVVVGDIPAGATAVGVPAKVIKQRGVRVDKHGTSDLRNGTTSRPSDILSESAPLH